MQMKKPRNLCLPLLVEEGTWNPNPISTTHIWTPVWDEDVSGTNTNLCTPNLLPTPERLSKGGGWEHTIPPS